MPSALSIHVRFLLISIIVVRKLAEIIFRIKSYKAIYDIKLQLKSPNIIFKSVRL